MTRCQRQCRAQRQFSSVHFSKSRYQTDSRSSSKDCSSSNLHSTFQRRKRPNSWHRNHKRPQNYYLSCTPPADAALQTNIQVRSLRSGQVFIFSQSQTTNYLHCSLSSAMSLSVNLSVFLYVIYPNFGSSNYTR